VNPGRLQEVDLHAVDDKGERVLALEEFRVIDARQPQEIGAAPLRETQIARMVNDAREIRVLVIDAHRQYMAPPLDAPGKIGPALRAHASSPPPKSPPCRASLAADGAGRPRWAKAAAVSTRPRGVRFTKPCWIR